MALGKRLGLYYHTARHLRWEQWLYRPIRRFQALLPPPGSVQASPGADAASRLAAEVAAWEPASLPPVVARADEVAADTFRFLNHAEWLPRVEWRRRYVSHLWSYNLHYFDYALDLAWAYRHTGNPVYPARFRSLAQGWMDEVGAGGGDGWEPYAVSLRVVNWLYALWLFGDALDDAFRGRAYESVARQSAALASRTERHILANHLQKNLKALVVAGLAYAGREAERWTREAEQRMWDELAEQVLPDGVHYERSPMYHAIALGDYLEVVGLYRALGRPVPPAGRERLAAMLRAMPVLARPDGTLHLFNDAAQGIAPSTAWLRRMAARLLPEVGQEPPTGAVAFPEGGYYAYLDPAAGERLVIDCGEPGPRYQPGHAHCDLLSFELDLGGRPVVVDSGTSGYGSDPFREYTRSVRAHNTLSIAGREQSELWGTFRVARRASVVGAEHAMDGGSYRFSGAYRPYHDPAAVHRRTIEGGRGVWTVTDRVEGAPGARVTSFLHLHPALAVQAEGDSLLATSPEGSVRVTPFGAGGWTVRTGEVQPVQGWYAPEFGRAVPAPVLEMRLEENDGRPFGYRIERVSR